MSNEKIRRERFFASKLLDALGIPDFVLVESHTDNPDVLYQTSKNRIGIEVTSVHRSTGKGRNDASIRENEHIKIVQAAQTKYADAGYPPLSVIVHFNGDPVKSTDRQPLAEWLFETVSINVPNEGESFTMDSRFTIGCPGCVMWVDAFRIRNAKRHHWHSPVGGFPESGGKEAVVYAIEKKNKAYRRYRLICDACWLLLVATWQTDSEVIEWVPEMAAIELATPFDRIYFMDATTRDAYRPCVDSN